MDDVAGRLLALRDANGVGYDATYDAMGRPLTRRSTHGEQTSTTYDLHGNVLTATDALLNTTVYTYDYRDRKSTCTDRIGGLTQYFYDLANHLTTIKDADSAVNGVTTYLYNNLGLLTKETFPAGKDGKKTVRTYAYDNGRRLWTRTITTTPAATPTLNEKTTYGYDVANRLTSRTYTDGKGNDSFVYDDAGRMTKAASGRYGSTVDRAYSGGTPAEIAGRLRTEKLTLTGTNAGNWTVTYGYDAANRVTSLTYPTTDKVTRTYTPRHQLDTVKIGASTVAKRLYDFSGRLITTTLGNNQVENRTYRSDVNGVDDQLATQSMSGATNFAYLYDANGRITEETNNQFTAQTQKFLNYDNENRLTNWQRGSDTQSWILSKVGDWTSTTINGISQTRSHSAVHEVTALGATPINYDLKGNLTLNEDGFAYNWDSENRLTSATVTDATYGASDTVTYRYDALGRRVQKTVYGMVTTFIHAGAQVVHEFDAKVQLPTTAQTDDGNGTGTPPGGGILQGAGVTRFNYQPSRSPIPSGFFADKGSVFGVRSNGKSYGWLTTARTDTVIRNQHPLPQFDTFNQAWLNNTGSAGTWEITVANGTYAVIVVMGDAASANQTNNLTIEGQAQTDPDPAVVTPPGYRRGDFDGYAVTANVTDGKLTLAIPSTALNPKLCFIEIGPQGSAITQADRDRLASAITDAVSDTSLPPFPKVQPSPRLYVYGSYVDEPLMMKAGGQNYYYATNRLYSVAAISDQTGAVVERYKYDAYGKQGILAPNGVVAYKPSDYGSFHGFTGRYHDFETGLAYFRARYFDHNLGRFIGRDPAGYVDGNSLYNGYFVPNGMDPMGMFDEAGHFALSYAMLIAMGADREEAYQMALWSQLPDEVAETDAMQASPNGEGDTGVVINGAKQILGGSTPWRNVVQNTLHSLLGDDPQKQRTLISCMLKGRSGETLSLQEKGLLLHALGDAYAHVDEKTGKLFATGAGHAAKGTAPDSLYHNKRAALSYIQEQYTTFSYIATNGKSLLGDTQTHAMFSSITSTIHGIDRPGIQSNGHALILDGPSSTRIGYDALNSVSGYGRDYNPLYQNGSYKNKDTGNGYFLPKGITAEHVQRTANALILKIQKVNAAGCCK